jgi:hypothetical protein
MELTDTSLVVAVTATVRAHGGHRPSVRSPYVPSAVSRPAQTLPGSRA